MIRLLLHIRWALQVPLVRSTDCLNIDEFQALGTNACRQKNRLVFTWHDLIEWLRYGITPDSNGPEMVVHTPYQSSSTPKINIYSARNVPQEARQSRWYIEWSWANMRVCERSFEIDLQKWVLWWQLLYSSPYSSRSTQYYLLSVKSQRKKYLTVILALQRW